MDEAAGRELVSRADADPTAVRVEAERWLLTVEGDLGPAEALGAWALGLALRHQRELRDAVHWLERASAAMTPGSADHTGVTLSWSGTLAYLGDFDEALRVLDGCEPSDELAGRVRFQRAAMSEHRGEVVAAEQGYAASLVAFERAGDRLGEAHALNGLGLIAVARADGATAVVRFGRAASIYDELSLPMLAAIARHNLGFAAMRSGHVVGALPLFDRAERELARLGEHFIEIELDRVEALLLCGLHTEAIERAVALAERLDDSDVGAERLATLVGVAESVAGIGRHDLATRYLDAAIAGDSDDGHWRRVARLRRLTIAPIDEAAGVALRSLADDFAHAGHQSLAADAALALVVGGAGELDLDWAVEQLHALPATDLRHRLAEVLTSEARGDAEGAARAAATLFAEVGAGGPDLSLAVRAGLTAHCATAMRSVVRVARAQDQPEPALLATIAMQQLFLDDARNRSVRAELPDDVVDALRADTDADPRKELHVSVTEITDVAERPGREAPRSSPEAPGQMPVFVVIDQQPSVTVLRLDGGRATFDASFDRAVVDDRMRRFSSVLERRATEPTATDADRQLRNLSDAVVELLPWLAGGEPIAVVATGAAAAWPWAGVAQRPVRMALDPTPVRARPARGGRVLVVGPDTRSGRDELDTLRGAASFDQLTGSAATPEAVLHAVSTADVLHLACHARHESSNPMLSALLLHGGSLTGHEIDRCPRSPRLVVAAACRAGTASSSAGSLATGIATAWLAAGTETVVAPTSVIPDDERTVEVMAQLHGAVASGVEAEVAVHDLRRDRDPVVARSLQAVGRLLMRDDDPSGVRRSRV